MGLLPIFLIVSFSSRKSDGRSKVLPLAALYMILFSFIPPFVLLCIIYSKGFYDCIGEYIALVPSLIFFILWVQTYSAVDNWRKRNFPVSQIHLKEKQQISSPPQGSIGLANLNDQISQPPMVMQP